MFAGATRYARKHHGSAASPPFHGVPAVHTVSFCSSPPLPVSDRLPIERMRLSSLRKLDRTTRLPVPRALNMRSVYRSPFFHSKADHVPSGSMHDQPLLRVCCP